MPAESGEGTDRRDSKVSRLLDWYMFSWRWQVALGTLLLLLGVESALFTQGGWLRVAFAVTVGAIGIGMGYYNYQNPPVWVTDGE